MLYARSGLGRKIRLAFEPLATARELRLKLTPSPAAREHMDVRVPGAPGARPGPRLRRWIFRRDPHALCVRSGLRRKIRLLACCATHLRRWIFARTDRVLSSTLTATRKNPPCSCAARDGENLAQEVIDAFAKFAFFCGVGFFGATRPATTRGGQLAGWLVGAATQPPSGLCRQYRVTLLFVQNRTRSPQS